MSDHQDKSRLHFSAFWTAMKSKASSSARSVVLTTLVVLAIASAVTSALYVSGTIGNHQEQTTTMTTLVSPGGFMLVKNATATFCTMSTTENSSASANGNGTTTITTSSDCLPIGYR
ncbi:MAG: hypothetical protein ACHQ1H_12810 [Nitrososphaerales archaeon]